MLFNRYVYWLMLIFSIGLVSYGLYSSINLDRHLTLTEKNMINKLRENQFPWISMDNSFRIEKLENIRLKDLLELVLICNHTNHDYYVEIFIPTDNLVLRGTQIQFLVESKYIHVYDRISRKEITNSIATQYIIGFFQKNTFKISDESVKQFNIVKSISIGSGIITFSTVEFVYIPKFSLILAVGLMGLVLSFIFSA